MGGLANKGWLGVYFFFVLSGFIILFAHWKDLGRPGQLKRYAWRRFFARLSGLLGLSHPVPRHGVAGDGP